MGRTPLNFFGLKLMIFSMPLIPVLSLQRVKKIFETPRAIRRRQMGVAEGTGKDFFVGRRLELKGGRGTPMASAMEDAMRTMKVKALLFGEKCMHMISIHKEEEESASSLD